MWQVDMIFPSCTFSLAVWSLIFFFSHGRFKGKLTFLIFESFFQPVLLFAFGNHLNGCLSGDRV